jgi:hypothetical protein
MILARGIDVTRSPLEDGRNARVSPFLGMAFCVRTLPLNASRLGACAVRA